MEDNKEHTPEPLIIQKESKTNRVLVVITLLLAITCGYLVWKNYNQQQQLISDEATIEGLSVEQIRLKDDLEEMLSEYEMLETESEDMQAEMELQKTKIEELLQKVKNGNWEIHKLKKEAATLREIMKGYIFTIDSLNTLNQTLIVENKNVLKKLDTEKIRNQELEKTNTGLTDKVALAQRLKAFNIESYGVYVKANNTGKETDKAKKTDKLRTCFTVAENKLTEPGDKDLYIRILTPDGRVLSQKKDASNRFEFNGVMGIFSIKKTIKYKSEEMKVCMDWENWEELPIGEYVVEIYHDGGDIGRTKLTLR
jgi:hypothetical protein